MESKFCFVFLLLFCTGVQGASYLETSYEYLMHLGKNFAPNLLSLLECVRGDEPMGCAREKAAKMLDIWGEEVEKDRLNWEQEADAEVRTSGRSLEEMPSKLGREITDTLGSLSNILEKGVARALERKKHDHGGGIDSITISTGDGDKKKMKKKKPPKIHLIHPVMVPLRKAHKEEKGRNFGNGVQSWVIGERALPEAVNATPAEGSLEEDAVVESRGMFADLWSMGRDALDNFAERVVENENLENGFLDRDSEEEQRGKKKKKKKAILKLLILGAVIKAKIGTLLQILTYKLQVKFFIIALLGLGINLARLWIEIKNKNSSQPQKIIYYEHAQHQHHYDHEEEEHGWGPWSRSILPEDDSEADASDPSPYKAQERNPLIYNRPYFSRV